MLDNLGKDFAKRVLDAHEDEVEPEASHRMDRANNLIGLRNAEKLIKDGKYSKENLIEEFKKSLKKNELIILIKRQK